MPAMKISAFAFAAFLGLAACSGEQSQSENTADALENAAEQSTPEAAAVLENEADRIREQNVTAPIDAPGSPAQNALQAAGNAQAGAPPRPAGDATPPPRTSADEGNHSGH
jgi:hypothetical protein